MSGNTFKPEAEVVDDVHADTAEGNVWDAAQAGAFDAMDDMEDDAQDDDDPEIEADEEEAEPVGEVSEQADDEPGSDDGVADTKAKDEEWDGNPDTLSEVLKPKYKAMERWFHQKNREDAAGRRELQALLAENRALNAEFKSRGSGPGAGDQKASGPPPLPSGENVTDAQYIEALDARARWFAKQELEEAIASGRVISQDAHREVDEYVEAEQRKAHVMRMPGFNDEVGNRMGAMAQSSPQYAQMLLSDRGIEVLFSLAKTSMENEALRAEAASLKASAAGRVTDDTKHKAGAIRRAVSRPGGAAKQAPSIAVGRNASVDDRLDAARRFMLESK